MFGFQPFRLPVFIQYTLIQAVLSAPYLATSSLNNKNLDTPRQAPSPITIHPLNITYQVEESGIKYHVPNTLTTLYFHLGFPCKEAGMHNTINSALGYCEQQLEQEGDSPLPRSEDPFHEDLGFGAAIDVVSARPDHRMTWGILKNAMDGLREFLVEDGRYVECEFDICHSLWDLVGRGTIKEAPETEFARQSRKRAASDDVGPVFA